MLPESVADTDRICPSCGYKVKRKDEFYIIEHGVWHLICYNCGDEWVV